MKSGVIAAACLAMLALAGPVAAGALPDSTRVTYVSGATVYVNAGGSQGLALGDTLNVIHEARVVARVLVTVLSPRRASCDTLSVEQMPIPGDRIEGPHRALASAPHGSPTSAPVVWPAPVAQPTGLMTPPLGSNRLQPWLRGRAGLRWFSTVSSLGSRLDRPMLDLRVDGTRARGPMDVAFDIRAHHTSITGPQTGGEEMLGRVYRASLGLRGHGAGPAFVIGRQSGPGAGSLSLFDGIAAAWNQTRWSGTLYGGTEPEPLRMGVSTSVAHAGGFVEARQRPGSEPIWNARLGYASSYDHAHPSRDFSFAQSYWRDRRLSVSVQQEVDLARAWKREIGAGALTPTNTFATASYEARAWLQVSGGYDSRRNARLWRDRETPETQFDDQFRAGGWIGASFGPRDVRLDGEVRNGTGGGQSDLSWSGSVSYLPRISLAPAVRTRYAAYRTDLTDSRLASVTVSLDPPGGFHLESSGGRRTYDDGLGSTSRVDWFEGAVEWSPATRWFVHGSWTFEQSDPENLTETLGGLSIRF